MKWVVGITLAIFLGFTVWAVVYHQIESQPKTSEQSPQPKQSTNVYTAAQIAAHNQPSDCWLIIQGTVYDVSGYIEEHPAPPGLIEPYCGKDATEAFVTKNENSSHSRSAWELLTDYEIGTFAN